MQQITDFLYWLDDLLWGNWMTVAVVGTGIFLSLRVPRDVLSHLAHADILALLFDLHAGMRKDRLAECIDIRAAGIFQSRGHFPV